MKNMTFRTQDYKSDKKMIALIADELIADTKRTHDMYVSYDTIDALSHHHIVVSFDEHVNRKSFQTTITLSDHDDPQVVKDKLSEEISEEIERLTVDLAVSTLYHIQILASYPSNVIDVEKVKVRFSKEVIDDRVVINAIHLVAKADDFNEVIKAIAGTIKSPFALRTLTEKKGELYVIATAPVYRNQYIERHHDIDEEIKNFEEMMLMMSLCKQTGRQVNVINPAQP